MTKEEILEEYFNLLELGNLTQGVEAAARFYFNVPASELSLSQAAFLAGLAKSPTQYNPLRHFARALKRRDWVLKQMLDNGFIDREMYDIALAENWNCVPPRARLARRILRVFTAACAVLGQRRLRYDRPRAPALRRRTGQNYVSRLAEENVTNAAAVVVENDTGAVLAYVGSADFYNEKNNGQVDGARALRQPGSALKPFVYGLAFEKGALTPASLIEDEDTFLKAVSARAITTKATTARFPRAARWRVRIISRPSKPPKIRRGQSAGALAPRGVSTLENRLTFTGLAWPWATGKCACWI